MPRPLKHNDKYRSQLERDVANQLQQLGAGFQYESEQIKYRARVSMGVCGKCDYSTVYQNRKYTPDFILENGIRLEVKGRLTAKDRNKILLVREQHPDLDLRLVFGYNNKLDKNKPERYSDWAKKHNIRFCIKEVPESWTK